jgi:hypothetical protein
MADALATGRMRWWVRQHPGGRTVALQTTETPQVTTASQVAAGEAETRGETERVNFPHLLDVRAGQQMTVSIYLFL